MQSLGSFVSTNMFRFKLAGVLLSIGTVVLAQQLPFNAASPATSPTLADLLTVVSYSPASRFSRRTLLHFSSHADSSPRQQNPRASIFYDYCRENSLISSLLVAPGEKTTLFVPTNAVIQALARKPSSGPPADRTFAAKSRDGEEEDRSYLEQWILLHMTGGIDLESEDDFEMMSGKTCSLKLATESASGDFTIQRAFHRMRLMPANIEVIDVIEVRIATFF